MGWSLSALRAWKRSELSSAGEECACLLLVSSNPRGKEATWLRIPTSGTVRVERAGKRTVAHLCHLSSCGPDVAEEDILTVGSDANGLRGEINVHLAFEGGGWEGAFGEMS